MTCSTRRLGGGAGGRRRARGAEAAGSARPSCSRWALQMVLYSVTSTFLYLLQVNLVDAMALATPRAPRSSPTSICGCRSSRSCCSRSSPAGCMYRLGLAVALAVAPVLTALGFLGLAVMPSCGCSLASIAARRHALRAGAALARDALHHGEPRGALQGQELHRHGGVPGRGRGGRPGGGWAQRRWGWAWRACCWRPCPWRACGWPSPLYLARTPGSAPVPQVARAGVRSKRRPGPLGAPSFTREGTQR